MFQEILINENESTNIDGFFIDNFIGLELFNQIRVLGTAYEEFQQKIKEQIDYDFSLLENGWNYAKQILEWIVLFAVNDEWCERNKDKSCQAQGMSLDIALNSEHAHGIIFFPN